VIAIVLIFILLQRSRHNITVAWIGGIVFCFACLPVLIQVDRGIPPSVYHSKSQHKRLAPGWNFIRNHSRERHEKIRIAYCGTNGIYPLYGEEYNSDPVYVPVNNAGTKTHEYKNGE